MARERVFITGIGGFIGGQAARWLSRAGYDVAGCLRRPCDKSDSFETRLYAVNLPSPALREILTLERPDWLLHCAGPARVDRSLTHPDEDFQANVVVTEEVLGALAHSSPYTRVVLLSSAAVYGEPAELPISERTPTRPISPYGRHKLLCEELAREYQRRLGVSVTSLRVFSAYGPGLRRQVLWEIVRQTCQSPIITLGGTGEERRDFIYVDDLARVMGRLIERDAGGYEILNVASGTSVSIAEAAAISVKLLGVQRRVAFTGEDRPGFPKHWQADIRALSRLGLGEFMSLESGLRQFIPWAIRQLGGLHDSRVLAAAG